jgi:hypothetical protein
MTKSSSQDTETIVIQGKRFSYRFEQVPVNQIVLDPKNPRIQFLIGNSAQSQDEIDAMLWRKEQVRALKVSIEQNEGVHEPVILEKCNGKLVCREGNCRVVSSRHLVAEATADTRALFEKIPARIFNSHLSEEDLAIYLADIHVTGKIPWDAYEKARIVHEFRGKYGKTWEWVSNHLRMSKSKIAQLLDAFSLHTDFLKDNPGVINGIKKFTFFDEITNKKELKEKFQKEPAFKKRLTKWITEDRLTAARQIRELPLILNDPEAVKTLDTSGFQDARRVAESHDPSMASDAFLFIRKATEQLKKLPVDDIQDIKQGNQYKITLLKKLSKAIDDVKALSDQKWA